MKTSHHPPADKLVHAAFLDALSGEFITRTGYGAYVYLSPLDVYKLFDDYLHHDTSVREYVRRTVKMLLNA